MALVCSLFVPASTAGAATAGPYRASANGRYLVDAAGDPFFVHGEAAWSAIANLTEAEAITYLDDCQARGFNAIVVNLIEHLFAANAPDNAAGDPPFTGVAFQSTPGTAYFDHVRWFMEAAAERGIVVFLNPAYLGFSGGAEGWHVELEAAAPADATAWGTFVGTQLGAYDNVVWHMFGDFDPPSHAKTNLVQAAIAVADPLHPLFAHHFSRGDSSHDDPEPWLSWNYVYPPPVGYMHVETLDGYNAVPTIPQILGEGYYEGDPDIDDLEELRRQAWGALTSGAAGHFYGNRDIWGFGDGFGTGAWQDALDDPGRQQMAYVKALFTAHSWWLLEPDQTSALVTQGRGPLSDADYVTAARASDGSWGIAYLPSAAGPITVDLGQLSAAINASWFDPRSGASTSIGSFPNHGTQVFTKPDGSDWVLVLDTPLGACPGASCPKRVPLLPGFWPRSLLAMLALLVGWQRLGGAPLGRARAFLARRIG